jgi:hypothetical protein
MHTIDRLSKGAAALAATLLLAQAAHAGPPLICHPFVIGAAPALPWKESEEWRAPRGDYDVGRLAGDVLALLNPETPTLARMENLRRATIYAADDSRAAEALLAAILGRTHEPRANPRESALSSFDAGYLLESYRQFNVAIGQGMPGGKSRTALPSAFGEDGYALVMKAAAELPERSAEIEFAASLMTSDAAASERHRMAAAAHAPPGSLLALNIARWGS